MPQTSTASGIWGYEPAITILAILLAAIHHLPKLELMHK